MLPINYIKVTFSSECLRSVGTLKLLFQVPSEELAIKWKQLLETSVIADKVVTARATEQVAETLNLKSAADLLEIVSSLLRQRAELAKFHLRWAENLAKHA